MIDVQETDFAQIFDMSYKFIRNISDIDVSSKVNQIQISDVIKKLEDLTKKLSCNGVFSDNENINEVEPNYINLLNSDRLNHLRLAKEYYEDFFKICKNYSIKYKHFLANTSNNPDNIRNEKIANYKLQQNYDLELENLEKLIKSSAYKLTEDGYNDILKNYYIKLIEKFANQSQNELNLINLEIKVIEDNKSGTIHKNETIHIPPKTQSYIPLINQRTKLKDKVFGKGYPSLPTMTPAEWYDDKMERECAHATHSSHSPEPQKAPENVEEESLKQKREYDDWKDTHRRGWGNTYNMG
ncbi:unnamed protein product [Gordionus sp. m RMFG-2023]|uniref:immunoglobulin-binding protein 1 family member C-like isoform X2 n=1 Tax=Gordionus sp. m RMFG-2023 TaxID=3053472 RepID=UPI0030E169D1